MGHLGMVGLGDNLTFYVNTHTPSTGAAVDADAVPGYRVYEEETETPLLTGSMAKLDDANTTGFYAETIAVTPANGFEVGKSYCVRVTGVVGGATGAEVLQFLVNDPLTAQDVWDALAAALLALQGADGDTLETLSDQLDGVEPADVWAYATRTLTSVASGTGVTDASGEAEIRTHDYFSKSISGLGDLSSRTGSGMVFTVKRSYSDADSAAIVQVSEVGGLTVLNSATYATTTDGSITVTDENTGALTVVLLTGATSNLTIERGLLYDIKQIKADGTSQVMERGTCNILGTATRKVA